MTLPLTIVFTKIQDYIYFFENLRIFRLQAFEITQWNIKNNCGEHLADYETRVKKRRKDVHRCFESFQRKVTKVKEQLLPSSTLFEIFGLSFLRILTI